MLRNRFGFGHIYDRTDTEANYLRCLTKLETRAHYLSFQFPSLFFKIRLETRYRKKRNKFLPELKQRVKGSLFFSVAFTIWRAASVGESLDSYIGRNAS